MPVSLANELPEIELAINPAGPVTPPAARLSEALDHARHVNQPPTHAELAQFVDMLISPPTIIGGPPAWTPTPAQQNALLLIMGPPGPRLMGVPAYNFAGFLNMAGPLTFANFDRMLVALQLVIRVADPKLIKQGQHPLCGPVVLMESFARTYPDYYAAYVTGMCTNLTGNIQTGNGAKRIRLLPNSNLLTANPTHAEMPQADYVALASLRDQGQWFIYTPYRSAYTVQLLEGATMAMTLSRWLEEAGYRNVADHTLSRSRNLAAKMVPTWGGARAAYGDWLMRNNVQQAITELGAGKAVFLCVASNFAHFALGRDDRDSTVAQAFAGHWATLVNAVVGANGVNFSIRTWGEETVSAVPMPWSKVGNWYRGFICATP